MLHGRNLEDDPKAERPCGDRVSTKLVCIEGPKNLLCHVFAVLHAM